MSQDDRISKGLDQRAATNANLASWQEFLNRFPSCPAEAQAAAQAVAGFSGSWASVYHHGETQSGSRGANAPVGPQVKINKLGQPGYPEINFAPYSHNTNRYMTKGPSLLGHPISFEIIGPTLKSPWVNWQWLLSPAAGGVGDILTLDTFEVTAGGGPEAVTIEEGYGFAAADLATAYPGGLYVVISQTGSAGALDGPVVGGVGDGLIWQDGNREPITPRDLTSKWEIFRVVSVDDTSITLDSGKNLTTYFTWPGLADNIVVRAITLMTPKATRLVPVSGSGPTKGREQVFVTVPPTRALNHEHQPPNISWTNRADLDPKVTVGANNGLAADYRPRNRLPIPTPIREGRLLAIGTNALALAGYTPVIGRTILYYTNGVDFTFDTVDDIGRILHLTQLTGVTGTTTFQNIASDGFGTRIPLDAYLGWFEITSFPAAGGAVEMRRLIEVDPRTGIPYMGDPAALVIDVAAVTGATVKATLHEPIETLFSRSYYPTDDVAASRLTHLIDPSLVKRSVKHNDGLPPGSTNLRADRAVFDTTSGNSGADGSNANPGSLMDLGFRAVLFPGKSVVDVGIVPDFERPITSNEVVLDPSETASQSITVDYSSGLVFLSHPPVPGAGCDVAPGGILTGDDNIREEMVLFMSCVPYSMEVGQRSTGVRVTALAPGGDWECFNTVTTLAVDGAGAQTLTCTNEGGENFDLTAQDSTHSFPLTGFIEVVDTNGDPIFLSNGRRASTFGYCQKVDLGAGPPGTRLLGCYGGGVTAAAHLVVGGDAVFSRKDVRTPNTTDGVAGTEYQQDTTYGYAKRNATVRFSSLTVFTVNLDGSVTLGS